VNKPVYKSKINWVALGLVVLGAVQRPEFWSWFGQFDVLFPDWFVAEAIQWAGVALFIFRTFMTTAANQVPGPDSPPDLILPDNKWTASITEAPMTDAKIEP
jgi:hypothetical protein